MVSDIPFAVPGPDLLPVYPAPPPLKASAMSLALLRIPDTFFIALLLGNMLAANLPYPAAI